MCVLFFGTKPYDNIPSNGIGVALRHCGTCPPPWSLRMHVHQFGKFQLSNYIYLEISVISAPLMHTRRAAPGSILATPLL